MLSHWRYAVLPAVLLSVFALIARGSASPGAKSDVKQKDVVIWGVNVGADSKGTQAMINEFKRRNPDLNVRVLSMGAGGMDPQKLMTSIVGEVSPDVIAQDRFTISDWASRGAFRSLDDLMARDGDDPLCPKPDQYYDAPWEEASFQGKVYGIPTGCDNRALYWNKKIFREKAKELRSAGLDPDRPPRTWSELLKYSKVLTEYKKDGTLKRAGFMPNYGNSWLYLYAFQNDANFMSEDGRTCTLDTPASEEALKFVIDGYKLLGGYANAKAFETGFLGKENDPFLTGQVVMKIDGNWILNTISRYGPSVDFGVDPAPVPDGRYELKGRFANDRDKFITWSGGFSYAIPSGARNTEGGWRFIKWATSVEGRLVAAKAQKSWEQFRGRSYIPNIEGNRLANEQIFKQFKPADPKFADALREHIDLMPVARTRPVTFVGQPLWDAHVRAMESALYGAQSPKQALLEGQNSVQRELDYFYSKDQFKVIDLRIPFLVFGVLLVAGLVFAGWRFRRQRLGRLAKHEAFWGYALTSPWTFGFLIFTLGPMLASFFLSFTQYNVLSPARWVGLKNYQILLGDDSARVIKAFSNAVYLGGIGVPLGLATGLAVALLLNSGVRGMRFYRTCFYMPAIVPVVASAVLWIWILTPDESKGLINYFWAMTISPWLGVKPPEWLNSADWAKPALIIMGLWGAGSGMLLWLAGLKGVPSTLYEAASLDGAGPNKQFWNVTFPHLTPIIFFNAIMGFIGALQEFDRIYVMKPAGDGSVGPADSLLMPVFHLFTNGFSYFKMGYASAIAWVVFAIILLLTLFQFKLAPRWVYYEAEK